MMRRRRVDLVVDLLADKVDAEGDESDAEARSGVTELIGEHRMLPPLVSSPEKFSGGSQRKLIRHCKSNLLLVVLLDEN